MTLAVYSPGRAQQLRVLLWAAVVLGGLFIGLGVFVLTGGGSFRYSLFLAVPGLLVLLAAMTSLRRLEERGRPARVGAVVTGVLLVLLGMVVASIAFGVLPSVVGVLLLLMALLPDVGDQ